MTNGIIREELKKKKYTSEDFLLCSWNFGADKMVRKMRFEMSDDEQMKLLALISEIAMNKEDFD